MEKPDSESLVEITTSRSSPRVMVVVWTCQGPLRLWPMFSAWIETSSRVPAAVTRHAIGLCRPESNLKGSETPISPSLLECFPGGGVREDRSQESVGPFFGELA